MSKKLDEIKQELLDKQRLSEIVDPARSKVTEEKMARGVRDIPVNRMIEQVNYLDKEILPKLEKRSGGKESADYKFFSSVCESLLYAVSACDRYDFMAKQLQYQKIQSQLLIENQAILEGELQKYSTIEEIYFQDGLRLIADGVKARVAALLKNKKPL